MRIKVREKRWILGWITNRIEEIMGTHGEANINHNGKKFIAFCIVNGLRILNTFFEHKDIHKYAREEKSWEEKSIIDHFLTNKTQSKKVKHVKLKNGI